MTKKVAPENRKKMGRPTIFTQELADRICEKVATSSFGLGKLCQTFEWLPDKDTINVWRYQKPDFSLQYNKAKLAQAELMAEEILEIADDGKNDWMESLSDEEKGLGWRFNGEHSARSRLRVETRKWLAAKLLPRTYGPLVEAEKKSLSDSLVEKFIDKIK
jgi:hypothetical protein